MRWLCLACFVLIFPLRLQSSRRRARKLFTQNYMELADARVSTLAQNSACATAKVESQRIRRAKTMLKNASHLKGLVIRATDGEIGTVDQLYFDD